MYQYNRQQMIMVCLMDFDTDYFICDNSIRISQKNLTEIFQNNLPRETGKL